MGKTGKRILKFIGISILVGLGVVFIWKYSTKAHSPEATIAYTEKGLNLEVFYNRPYKKDRDIFGALVPYGEVWRTGANEATTFKTDKDLLVDGSLLKAGKYTLWTIPEKETWKIIFNSKMYPWGINLKKEAYRDSTYDALVLEVPVRVLRNPLEQFTIYFDKANDLIFLNLAWDKTLIRVPLQTKKEAPMALLLQKLYY